MGQSLGQGQVRHGAPSEMSGATLAQEWVVPEMFLSLMTNGPGEAPLCMPTLMADEWRFAVGTGKKGTIQGFSRCPHPGIGSDDGYGSRSTNRGLESVGVGLDPLSDGLSGVVESNSIRRLRRRPHVGPRATGAGTSIWGSALSALLSWRRGGHQKACATGAAVRRSTRAIWGREERWGQRRRWYGGMRVMCRTKGVGIGIGKGIPWRTGKPSEQRNEWRQMVRGGLLNFQPGRMLRSTYIHT